MHPKTEWLQQVKEEALEPELPICDTHHHLWDLRASQAPDERYLIHEFVGEFGGHNVVSSVFADCNSMYRTKGPEETRCVGETEFVQGMAAMAASGLYGKCSVAAGIVGWADLQLGARVAPVLEAHMAASPSRFRGIRFSTHWHEDPKVRPGRSHHTFRNMLGDSKIREGLACVERLGLSFDAAIFFHQIPEVTDLARAMPGLNIVLGHLGGLLGIGPYAGKRDQVFEEWKKSMAELAVCPNVSVKLGGLANPRYGFGWQNQPKPPTSDQFAEATKRYFLYCIECFGTERCHFESNFPIDKASLSYVVLWNAYKKITKGFSKSERAALFYDTAARVYRLSV
jgi:L-fuconolactonase